MELFLIFIIIIFTIIVFLSFLFITISSINYINLFFKILVIFFIIPILLSFLFILRNSYMVPESLEYKTADILGLPVKEFIIFTEDRTMISAWEIRYHSNAPNIVITHGLGDNKSSFLDFARALHAQGYNCFLFDFRAHGKSSGRITSFGYREEQDLKAVIEYVLSNDSFSNNKIALAGFSMGASVSLLVASEYEQVKAVIADSAYINLLDSLVFYSKFKYNTPVWLFRYPMRLAYLARFLKDPKAISCEKSVKNIDKEKAIFFIHGEKDFKIPYCNSEYLYDLFKGPKKLWIIPEAGHAEGLYIDEKEYIEKTIMFLRDYLPRRILWN